MSRDSLVVFEVCFGQKWSRDLVNYKMLRDVQNCFKPFLAPIRALGESHVTITNVC